MKNYSANKQTVVSTRSVSGVLDSCRYVFVQWVTYMGEIRTRVVPVKHFKSIERLGISRGNTGTLQNDGITSVVNTTGQIYIEPQFSSLRPAGITSSDSNAYFTVMSRWTDELGTPIKVRKGRKMYPQPI